MRGMKRPHDVVASSGWPADAKRPAVVVDYAAANSTGYFSSVVLYE